MTIPYPAPPLVGETFVLRPFRASDFDQAVALGADADDARWVEELPAPDGEAMERLCEADREDGVMIHLVIAGSVDDRYLGEVSLVVLEDSAGEIGCAVVPEARGRGIGTAVLSLVSAWAFYALSLRRLQAFIDPRNLASIRFAEKAGYRRECLLSFCWEIGGEELDALLFSRLKGDDTEADPAASDLTPPHITR